MKNIITLLVLIIFISSCDQEVINLKGNLQGTPELESYLIVKMKSMHCSNERILDTIDLSNGKFKFYNKSIKPPVKLTFVTEDSCEFDIWVGEYGLKTITGAIHSKIGCEVFGSFFYDELKRMNNNLEQMYLDPVKDKVEEALLLKGIKELSEESKLRLSKLEKDIKSAYTLRKKSILKTARKNSNNSVAIALMCQEFERLTSHQKKECYKYLSKSFGDTGLNWQMKN